jgi:hypothetical protein
MAAQVACCRMQRTVIRMRGDEVAAGVSAPEAVGGA